MVKDHPHQDAPRLSVIIPSRDGHRDGMVPALLESVARQTFKAFEVHLVKGVFPQGKAINEGADRAQAEILLILDDDSRLADEGIFQRLVDAIDNDPRIGMAGARITPPPEASDFQKRAAKQFPRFSMPQVETITDSDMACHGCCAIPAKVFDQVGRERQDLIRGLDPDLRERLRKAGYRVVLVPGATVYHPLPDGWRALLKTFFRNGYGSAYALKFRPDSIYETHEALESEAFVAKRSLAFRLMRFPLRLGAALLQGRLMRFSGYCAYACGYGWGLLRAREMASVETGTQT